MGRRVSRVTTWVALASIQAGFGWLFLTASSVSLWIPMAFWMLATISIVLAFVPEGEDRG